MKRILQFLLFFLSGQKGWTAEMAVTGITEVDNAIPEHWASEIVEDADRQSFWGPLTGEEGSLMPIIKKTGPLNKNGDLLHFQTIAQLMGSGVTNESVLKGNEEQLALGTFTVTATLIRHAVAVTKLANKRANYNQVQTVGKLLKAWAARKMDYDAFQEMKDNASNTIYANEKTANSELATTGETFGVAELELLRMALQRSGATPIQSMSKNGRVHEVYGCVFGEIEEYYLRQNTSFVQSLRDALPRGDDNPIFKGAMGMYGSMILYPYKSVLPIPQGTPLRPETTVYATLTTTATTLSVGGASRTTGVTPNYTLCFPSTGTIQIGDEYITYTGKTVNTFTGLTRGVSSTTAAQHVPDALVTERNIATVIGFGAGAVYRALPDMPKPIGDNDDYGMHIGLGIEAYYGQACFKDAARTNTNGIVLCKVYSANPGTV